MWLIDAVAPLFARTLLPVFLIIFAGTVLAFRFRLDGKTLGRILFYLATPSLVFRSLYQTQLELGALQRLALVAVVVPILTGFLGWLVARRESRVRRAAITLTSAVSNNGSMGIPITFFALGEAGLALGAFYYVVNSFMSNSVGVLVASAGRRSVRAALAQTLRVPVLYAALLGLALNGSSFALPVGLERSVGLLADAAIPGMLILVGLQLRGASLSERSGLVLRSTVIRLAIAPMIAWALCRIFAITGVEQNVVILQAAMPSAVMAAVLATEFDTAPGLVATAVFFSTVASMITLSVVLWFIL